MTTPKSPELGQPSHNAPERIVFVIQFHSIFRVRAGYPTDVIDLTYDVEEPLPPHHLKGIMRAEAHGITSALGLSTALVDQTFGTPKISSAWSWFGAEGQWSDPIRMHRVAIDRSTSVPRQNSLVSATAVRADRATFVVERRSGPSDDHNEVARQAALIRLSGRSIHHLGGPRGRGYGCVGVVVHGDRIENLAGAVESDIRRLTSGGNPREESDGRTPAAHSTVQVPLQRRRH